MANIRSAAKRARQTEVRTERNRAVKSRVKTFKKNVLEALQNGDKEAATKNLRAFSSAVDLAVKGNVVHKNSAARQKSALSKRLGAAS